MNIYKSNWADPPQVLWFKIAAQFYQLAVNAGATDQPEPFPTDTITVLLRKCVNYTAYLAT